MTIINNDQCVLICSRGERAALHHVITAITQVMAWDRLHEYWQAIGIPDLMMLDADYQAMLEMRDALEQ